MSNRTCQKKNNTKRGGGVKDRPIEVGSERDGQKTDILVAKLSQRSTLLQLNRKIEHFLFWAKTLTFYAHTHVLLSEQLSNKMTENMSEPAFRWHVVSIVFGRIKPETIKMSY